MLPSRLRIGIALLTLAPLAPAQTVEFTLDRILTNPISLIPRLPRVSWITGQEAFSQIREQDGVETLVRVEVRGELRDVIVTAADLKAAFGSASLSDKRLPPFSWSDEHTLRVEVDHAVWHWDLRRPEPQRALELVDGSTARAIASGDARAAFVVDADVVVRRANGALHRVTWDGSEGDIVYGGAAHRAEFGIHDGLWWDPTGRRLAFSREDMRPTAVYPYVDWTVQPARLRHGRYPMAGQPHSKVAIGVWDSGDASLRYLEHDPDSDLYWTNVTWSPDGARIYVALVSRGQDRLELVEFDAATGARKRVLLTESDPRWIEPEFGPIFLPDGSGRFLWFSPRDGFRNLYLHAADGRLERQLTRARFDLRSFGGFTADGEHAYATGSGADPLQMHLWRIDLETGELTRITQGRGRHACLVSDDDHVLDRLESAIDPGTLTLLPKDGEAREVARADDPLAGADRGTGEFFSITAADGTELHGYVLKPPGFDPAKRYPLIHYVYGGPHSQLVTDTWGRGANLWLHWMATQGFVVSCLDNRGTDNRGIGFSQAVFRRIGVLEVQDQVAAVRHLVEQGFVDPQRIGVHGWSYGGYLTLRLMLLAPDLFSCGVAGAPVTDWTRYETGYTERYMDTPQENPKGYENAACPPLAKNLKGRLLLITPSDDRTVMTSHSVAFLQACVDAGILVDHMSYPMQQHGLRGAHRAHFYRLMTRNFFEHLLNAAPRTAAAAARAR